MLTEYEKKIFKHRKKFIFLVFVIGGVYFWPTSLYGDSDYILLFGDSMLPTIEPAKAEDERSAAATISFFMFSSKQ